MRTTWILVADSARARLFEIPGARRPMQEIEVFTNPEGRARNRDLATDAQGRNWKVPGLSGYPGQPRVDPVEHDVELFVKSIARYLETARAQGRYDTLSLVAPPKFLGLLRGSLDKTTQKRLGREVSKDLSRSSAEEIEGYVRGNPEFELEPVRVTNVPKR